MLSERCAGSELEVGGRARVTLAVGGEIVVVADIRHRDGEVVTTVPRIRGVVDDDLEGEALAPPQRTDAREARHIEDEIAAIVDRHASRDSTRLTTGRRGSVLTDADLAAGEVHRRRARSRAHTDRNGQGHGILGTEDIEVSTGDGGAGSTVRDRDVR